MSIQIIFLALGARSSREITRFGDPPSFFVEICNVICVSMLCFSMAWSANSLNYSAICLGSEASEADSSSKYLGCEACGADF